MGGIIKFNKKCTLPTRVQNVGKVTCLFLSCYKRGQFPIVNIGPNYLVFIILCIYVYYNINFLILEVSTIYTKGHTTFAIFLGCSATLNFLGFLHTAFGDAGYPPSLVYRENMKFYGEKLKEDAHLGGGGGDGDDDDGDDGDPEQQQTH